MPFFLVAQPAVTGRQAVTGGSKRREDHEWRDAEGRLVRVRD